MPDRLATDIRLRHFLHCDGGLHPGGNTSPLEPVLEGDGVHHRGQHADVVSCGSLHARGRPLQAAEDVAAAHDDRQLGAIGHHLGHIGGNRLNNGGVDAIALRSHQSFAAEFQQDACVGHLRSRSFRQ